MRLLLLFASAWLGFAPVALAQGSTQLRGRVLDQTGGVLPGVTVDLVTGRRELTTITDAVGYYGFEDVPAGQAELTYRLLNFSVHRRSVDVGDSAPVTADVVMSLSLSADVVVTASRSFRNLADAERPSENLIGLASAASQGAVTAAQLANRPISRPGEVLEMVPGLVVSQHSGEGKANQYYLRGFNLDHGTDFSTTVAGIPVNTPTGAHSHGYADTSFVIPELVSGIQYKKGPYYADEGDFSAAGAAHINYMNTVERPTVNLSTGHFAWRRLFAAASPRVGSGRFLSAIELAHTDGPWTRPENYQKVNTVLRYSRGDHRRGLSVTGMGSWMTWSAADQVASRAVDNGSISRFGVIDATDGGRSNRQSLSADLERSTGSSSFRASGFVLRNSLNLFSNFTYFLDDPEHGDQFEQSERRITVGGRGVYRRLGHLFDRHTESAIGTQLRYDWLSPVGLYKTARRIRLETTREDRVGQAMLSTYARTEVEWLGSLRTTLGLRADGYRYQVTSNDPVNSGAGWSGLLSPKLGIVFGPFAATELYVNAGAGFHSNDARGAVTRFDPRTGVHVDPVTPLVRANGAEVGVRTVRLKGLQSTATLWYLGVDSELLFVGDAGTTEASRPSRRVGIEWTNYVRLTPWLMADIDLALSRARFLGDPTGNHIPGSLNRVISGGLSIEPSRAIAASVRLRHFGPRPLAEDASVRSRSTTMWNGEASYQITGQARVVLEMFNILNARAADIDYFYVSRLPGEPAEGVADVHTHPALPRSIRLGMALSF